MPQSFIKIKLCFWLALLKSVIVLTLCVISWALNCKKHSAKASKVGKDHIKIGLAKVIVRDTSTNTDYLWLVLPKRSAQNRRGLEYPGGQLKKGEKYKTAVKREVEEELGWIISRSDLNLVWTQRRADRTIKLFYIRLEMDLTRMRLHETSPFVNLPGPGGCVRGTPHELHRFKDVQGKHWRFKVLFTLDSYSVFVPLDKVQEFNKLYTNRPWRGF